MVGAPHTEIDALHHGPDWIPRADFVADVRALVAAPEWVTEWQYAHARPLIAQRCDLMVWLHYPFWTVTLPRVTRRTVRRRLHREVLWNGNVEPPLHTIVTDPDHIIRWAIATRHTFEERVAEVASRHPTLPIVHLSTPRDLEHWIAGPLTRASVTQ